MCMQHFIGYKKELIMIETVAHRYSSESAQREISNEYQHDRD